MRNADQANPVVRRTRDDRVLLTARMAIQQIQELGAETSAAVAHEGEPARGGNVKVTLRVTLTRIQAERVAAWRELARQYDVGFIGIKPFASGTLFASQGEPDSATKAEDDERARMALRHVLCCDVLHASIPGLITVDQVKNAVAAVKERRRFDMAEAARHKELVADMWSNLPAGYQWLRDWEWV